MSKTQHEAEGHGGKREGAGRKPEALSVRQAKAFEDTATRLAEEHGKTMQDVIGEMVYDSDNSTKDRMTAAKLYWDKSVIGATEGGDADKNVGPAVFLPEMHPRLELVKDAGTSSKDD